MLFFNLISIYLFVMVIAVIYWAAHVRSLNGSSYARTAVLLCLAISIYIFGYDMELNSGTESQILFWNDIEYFGIPFVSALWMTVGLMYTGHFSRHKTLWLIAIYCIPFVTMGLRLTNDYHHLYLVSINIVSEYGRLFFVKSPGPWMYVQLAHSMLMIFITLGLLIHDSVKNRERQPGKMALMIGASFFAVVGLILAMTKPFGVTIDYMAVCLPVTSLMVILAILRFDFLETKTMARGKVFEASRDAILLINRQNKVIDYNTSAKQLFGKIGINIADGYIAKIFEQTPDLKKSLEMTETSIARLNIDAAQKYYEISTKGIDNNSASHGWIKTIRDITEIYELNKSLKRQTLMDELSGLANRRAFIQIGKEWIKESNQNGRTVHLLMMDLDYFKRVNDKYGHQMGDMVIRYFGKTLKESFSSNSLVARLGGEEFGVLLTGFSDAEIKQKADMVLEKIGLHEYRFNDRTFHVTVSIGVAEKNRSARTLDHLMHIADKALYMSKDQGRNCVTIL